MSASNNAPEVMPKPSTNDRTDYEHFQFSPQVITKLKERDYEVLLEIGFGIYAKVFSANCVKGCPLPSKVAIRVSDKKKDSVDIQRKLMKELPEHQNVAKIYEVIDDLDDEHTYVVMEFCPNGDLKQYIENKKIKEREAYRLFSQLLSGVEHLHKNGFVHWDLKCRNIGLGENNEIKIIDFGLCGMWDKEKLWNTSSQEQQSNRYCGSHAYSSLELLARMRYLPTKNDIWSCGVILYTIVFGSPPNLTLQLKELENNDKYLIGIQEFPKSHELSDECKQLLKKILIKEDQRISIKEIRESQWYRRNIDYKDINQ